MLLFVLGVAMSSRLDVLTSEELAVGKLIALGLTNRQIAAQLCLSLRTVNRDVKHLLSKLAASGRSGVAAQISKESAHSLDPLVARYLLSKLTNREREVCKLAASGLTYEEIGRRLFIKPTSVKTHLRRSYAKLGITRRSALARLYTAG